MSNKRTLALISANRLAEPYPVYPIGISYLRTYLKEHLDWLDVFLLDMNLISVENLETILKETPPDYIGISIRNIDDIYTKYRRGQLP